MKIIGLLARLILGVAFCWSAVSKIADPGHFFANVMDYGLVTPSFAKMIAISLPWFELVLGLLLLGRICLLGSFFLSTALLLMFTVLQTYAMLTGLEISCGCFSVGGDADVISGLTVGRAAILAIIALIGLGIEMKVTRPKSSEEHTQTANNPVLT